MNNLGKLQFKNHANLTPKKSFTFFGVGQSLSYPLCYAYSMKTMMIVPEYMNNKNLMTFNGLKVRIFPSTQRGDFVTGEYLEGPSQGKWGTIDLRVAKTLQK